MLKSFNSSNFPGLDNIPHSVWKLPILHEDLLNFCNKLIKHLHLIDGKIPTAWTGMDRHGQRICPHIDPLLRPNQNGSRRARGWSITLPQILAIRRIIEECKIGKRSAAIVLVN